jgi:hypothetical protein
VGSIPDGVTEIFLRHNPYGSNTALESTHPSKEMSTRNNSFGDKGGHTEKPCHFHAQTVMKFINLNFLEPSGPVQWLLYLYLLHLNPFMTEFEGPQKTPRPTMKG